MKKILLIIISILSINFTNAQDCSELFISEYVEGLSNNKALEIYNPTNSPISLANYRIVRWDNGSIIADQSPEGRMQLPVNITMPPYSVYVIALNLTDPSGTGQSLPIDTALQNRADTLLCPGCAMGTGNPRVMCFNGDDALSLEKNINGTWTKIDIFGCIGERPSNSSGSFSPSAGWTILPPFSSMPANYDASTQGPYFLQYWTLDKTLRRKFNVKKGVTVNPAPDTFDASLEWDSLPLNTFNGLGTHNCNCLVNTCNLTIVNNPSNQNIQLGATAQFTVSASGTCSYQWQTNIGFGFQNLSNAGQYSGINHSTLSISNISAINNGQIFRCIISQGVCADTSNQAVLSITTCNINLVGQPQNVAEVVGNSAQFVVNANTSANYQWQTNNGFGFQNLSNAGQYSGANQSTLTVSNLTLTNNNQTFRCILNLNSCVDTTSIATLAVTTPVGIIKIKNAQNGIYPNPTSDFIFVDYAQLAINKVELIDIYGNSVLSSNLENGNRINISALAKGIYFIKLGDKNEFKKIVKK